MTGMTFFAVHKVYFWPFMGFVLLTAVYLAISYFIGIFGKPFDFFKHTQIINAFPDYKPTVDVYLPVCGEPLAVLLNTWTYVSMLDWPNKKIYVLDDSGSDEVKESARLFDFEYICRPNRGVLKKAGNLRHAFKITSGELIVIFDADFCPRTDFLKETVPYFAQDRDIAIVQTPQYFSIRTGQSWIEKGGGYIQELFYRMIQINRQTWGAAICVGTNAIYRRSALEPFGGTAAIGYSEDVHTGWNCLKLGYKIRYIPIILAQGICPDTVQAFFIQQYRWAMGSITLSMNKEFWKSKL
jgi:cellulose synthase/poly-beta-1,6-N-acetylglucosamine synthase-like glycosyltransferase